MVAGPYRAGSEDAAVHASNLRALNEVALRLFRAGHVPVIGVNMALPVVAVAGSSGADYHEIMLPLSLALADRCDACFRVGGPSTGADAEVVRFEAAGKPVYRSLEEVFEWR